MKIPKETLELFLLPIQRIQKVRDLILDGEIEKAEEEIKKEVEIAKDDSEAPTKF